jgi:glycosyltransferase involved in cell wall biosynthesis
MRLPPIKLPPLRLPRLKLPPLKLLGIRLPRSRWVKLRLEGDAMRDQRRWAKAEAAYRAYLAKRPGHWQIIVQLAHCVKEQGDLEGALALYRQAEALAPQDFDPPFQISHVLRVMGRMREAAEAAERAAERAPYNHHLRRAHALLRHRRLAPEDGPVRALAPRPGGVPTQLAFDVTDLLAYLGASRTPTGIQRVQMGILGAMLAAPAEGRPPLVLVAYDPSAWRWWHVEEDSFRQVLALARLGAQAKDPAWKAATTALCHADARPDAPLLPGATLATLGNAWGVEDYFRGLRMLRAAVPFRYVSFVHDCVPLAMPEHCLDLTVRLYARWFAALSLHADALLANSDSTRREVAHYAAALGWAPPTTVVRLAAAGLGPPAEASAARAAAAALPVPLPGERFVLFVATLESRKNHLMVFKAWLALVRRLGPDAVPRLVCVGKPGWHVEAALGLLDRVPELRQRVSVLHDVSDLALEGLYAGCDFTLYNSFHEGWGLPVSESLAMGKLAVVPAQSGLLESGAPGALFFPPQDEPALVAALERLVTDPAHLADLASRIDREAASRGWDVAAAEVLATLCAPSAEKPEPTLPLGERLVLGHNGQPAADSTVAWAERVREGLGWWWQDAWGCWMRDGVATLFLPVAVPAGTPMRVLLELRAPPSGITLRLRLRGAGGEPWRSLTLAPDQSLACMLQAKAGPGGLVVDLDAGDGVLVGDRGIRAVGAGIVAVMACREDDWAARLKALERAEGVLDGDA